MTQSMYFRHSELALLSCFSQLCSHIHQLILIFNCDFLYFSVDERFSLCLELKLHFFKLFWFWPLETSKAQPPFLYFWLKLLTPLLLQTILFLQPKINLPILCFILFELSVKLLAKNLHFLRLFLHSFFLQLIHMTSLSKLSNLHLITLIIMHLPFPILCLDSHHLNLSRQSLNLNPLKNNNKIKFWW